MTRFLPLAVFVILAALFAAQLLNGRDPAVLDSALLGKQIPAFDIPGLSSKQLRGKPALVNFFASWCMECRLEQGILEEIARAEKVPVYGIAYKDKKKNMDAWLKQFGDPYDEIGMDAEGATAIAFGVYGVPETFLIDKNGAIRHRHVGPVSDADYQRVFKPLFAEMRR